jgi:hypothetical protein
MHILKIEIYKLKSFYCRSKLGFVLKLVASIERYCRIHRDVFKILFIYLKTELRLITLDKHNSKVDQTFINP